MELVESTATGKLDIHKFEKMVKSVAKGKALDEAKAAAANDEPASEYEKMLVEAISAGDFDSRGALGQRFSRSAKSFSPEELQEFKEARSLEQKKAFRIKWANRRLKELRVKKVHLQEYKTVDESKGTYMVFPKMVEEYGIHFDPKGAALAALRYCKKAIAMGGQWLHYEPMSETMQYFHVKKQHSQVRVCNGKGR